MNGPSERMRRQSSYQQAGNRMHCECCRGPLGKINGRTLSQTLKMARRPAKLGQHLMTSWIEICLVCDVEVLSCNPYSPVPFLASDGAMRTIADFDNDGGLSPLSETLEFALLRFSRHAFKSAQQLCLDEDQTTPTLERCGARWLSDPSPTSVRAFSHGVCEWGRGARVFANLARRNGAALDKRLYEWLAKVPFLEPAEAIRRGIAIKGLDVSFASKHLRLLQPERFAVLDDVVKNGLGFAANQAGYLLFLAMLEQFREKFGFESMRLSAIEAGVFVLVRQIVRSVKVHPDAAPTKLTG